MPKYVAARVSTLRVRVAAWASNAWTRCAYEPAAARRTAGLRYWDGCGA